MKFKYSLNEEALKFVLDFEKYVAFEETLTNQELVEKFKTSTFHKEQFISYYPTAISKAIWWAVKRSGNWVMVQNGLYKRYYHAVPKRDEFIRYLSKNLHEVIQLKTRIHDEVLKKYHLSAKGLGDDLYFLTEGFFRAIGKFHGKHSMSDFITLHAMQAMESGNSQSNLIFEHMVPKNIYLKKITQSALDGKLHEEFIYDCLNKFYYVCTVTKDEDKQLSPISMDDGWDMSNPFYRYERAGIKFFLNNKEDI